MNKQIKVIMGVILCGASSSGAFAKEKCSPAKKLVDVAQSFYGDQPDLTNVIHPKLSVGMKGLNGHPDPAHMLYRFKSIENRLPIIDGKVVGLEAAVEWSKEGELCSSYKDGPLPETEEPTVSLSVGFEFPFRREDGIFSVKEITEGAKDGSKIIKSLAPSGLGFAAPSLKTFAVVPNSDEDDLPELIFKRGEDLNSVDIIRSDRTQYVRLKDIKSAKSDNLEIRGPYRAFAFFKIDPKEVAAQEAKRLAALENAKN